MRLPTPATILIISACLLSLAREVPAEGGGIIIGALKGPTGIGMVRLFENPPFVPGNGMILPVGVPSAELMVAKLVAGEYDAAVLPVNMAAKLYSSGIPIRLAAVVGNGMVSFLSSDPGIRSLADLAGKEIHVAGQGATPDYLFRKLLRGAGLDPEKDLRLSYALPYPEAAAALAAGKIRYAILPEPFTTLALAANPGLRFALDLGEQWKKATGLSSYPMSVLVVTSRLAKEQPQVVSVLMKAYAESIAWVVANPAEAGKLVEKHDLGLKAAIASKAIPRSNYVFVPAPQSRLAIEALLGVFLETAAASVGGKLPDAGFYAAFSQE